MAHISAVVPTEFAEFLLSQVSFFSDASYVFGESSPQPWVGDRVINFFHAAERRRTKRFRLLRFSLLRNSLLLYCLLCLRLLRISLQSSHRNGAGRSPVVGIH